MIRLVVLDKKNFKLPFVDPSIYRELMQLGLRYDGEKRVYCAQHLGPSNIDELLELLSRILKDKVYFEETDETTQIGQISQICIICGKSVQCEECRYHELCETKDVPSSCVCGRCLKEGKTSP